MLYLCEECLGKILFSDKLTEKFFENLSVVKDGLSKNTRKICFKRVTTENLLALKYFMLYDNEVPNGRIITSVDEALEEFAKGKHLYATGNYFTENPYVKHLGHLYWKNVFASGYDPHFKEKDAEIVGFIRNPNKLELVLKFTLQGNLPAAFERIHKFTIVQAHF